MKEYRYRVNFMNLLKKETGGDVFHPSDFGRLKRQQPDLLYSVIGFVKFELKAWDRKRIDWTWEYECKRNPKQTQFYKFECVQSWVFYIIYRKGKRHTNNEPDWIYCVNRNKYVNLTELYDLICEKYENSMLGLR